MPEFKLKIAGQVGSITCLFESTPIFLASYGTEAPADFSVTVSKEDLTLEQQLRNQEALEEGLRPRVSTGPFLERLVILRKFADHLMERDTLLLHGSAVAVDGAGYIFVAPCGTGKSTHTRLWRQVFGDRAVMVNDDKPFVRFSSEGIRVCGSPWSGKHGLDSDIQIPLRGICILERGPENRIRRADEGEIPFLRKQIRRSLDPELEIPFQRLTEILIDRVPIWHMACNMDPEAAVLSHSTMSSV